MQSKSSGSWRCLLYLLVPLGCAPQWHWLDGQELFFWNFFLAQSWRTLELGGSGLVLRLDSSEGSLDVWITCPTLFVSYLRCSAHSMKLLVLLLGTLTSLRMHKTVLERLLGFTLVSATMITVRCALMCSEPHMGLLIGPSPITRVKLGWYSLDLTGCTSTNIWLTSLIDRSSAR